MTLHRSEVMPKHYQLQLQLIIAPIVPLTVESILQYMYRCIYSNRYNIVHKHQWAISFNK